MLQAISSHLRMSSRVTRQFLTIDITRTGPAYDHGRAVAAPYNIKIYLCASPKRIDRRQSIFPLAIPVTPLFLERSASPESVCHSDALSSLEFLHLDGHIFLFIFILTPTPFEPDRPPLGSRRHIFNIFAVSAVLPASTRARPTSRYYLCRCVCPACLA